MAGDEPLPPNLTGNYFVRAVRAAFSDVHKLLNRTRERIQLRRHALKLRYWPEMHPTDDSGLLLDLDWSWIVACKPTRIGELRIHETIGDCDNLRVIFFDPAIRNSIPTIWVLAVMQKKSDAFTKANLSTFRMRRQTVMERFYKA